MDPEPNMARSASMPAFSQLPAVARNSGRMRVRKGVFLTRFRRAHDTYTADELGAAPRRTLRVAVSDLSLQVRSISCLPRRSIAPFSFGSRMRLVLSWCVCVCSTAFLSHCVAGVTGAVFPVAEGRELLLPGDGGQERPSGSSRGPDTRRPRPGRSPSETRRRAFAAHFIRLNSD